MQKTWCKTLIIVTILLFQLIHPVMGNDNKNWVQYTIHVDEQGNILYKQKIHINEKKTLGQTRNDQILASWLLEVESWVNSYNKMFGKNCVAKDHQVDVKRFGDTTIVTRSVLIEKAVDQVGSEWVLSEIFTERWMLRRGDTLTIELPPGAKIKHIQPKPWKWEDTSLHWKNINFSPFEPQIVYTLEMGSQNHFGLGAEIRATGEKLRRTKLCGVAGEAGYILSEAMEHHSTSQELYNMGRITESRAELEKTKKLLEELDRMGICPGKVLGGQAVGKEKSLGVATPLVFLCVTTLLAGLAMGIYLHLKRKNWL